MNNHEEYRNNSNNIEINRYKTLMQFASDGIHIVDENGKLIEFSDSFAFMLGYTTDEMRQLTVSDWEAQITHSMLSDFIRSSINEAKIFETKHKKRWNAY